MNAPMADEVRPGSILRGTYEITALIGEGGMGQVFAARHVRLPKQVAVKLLKTDLALSPDILARFKREAEIASRLGHPNIVEVLDFDTLPGGTPFLVLEFLKGESLAQRLERGPLPLDETQEIALQVGSALLAAHQAGVVHRDLKPDNIFLLPGDSTGATRHRVKLLDFGISKLSDGRTVKTQDSVLIGTPRYMSPEQALGNNQALDARSDVFALGCIYYEMLSGQPAFPGDNIPTLLYKIVHDAPRPLLELVPGIPAHTWPTLERALAKAVEDRTPDVATLTEAFTGTRLRAPASLPTSTPDASADTLDATFVPARASPATPAPTSAPTPARPSGTAPGELNPTFVPTRPKDTSATAADTASGSLESTFVPPAVTPKPEQGRATTPAADPAPAPTPDTAPASAPQWPRLALVGLLAAGVATTAWMRSRPVATVPPPAVVTVAQPPTPAPPAFVAVPSAPTPTPVPASEPESVKPAAPRKDPAPRAPAPTPAVSFAPKDEQALRYLESAAAALAARQPDKAYLSAFDSVRTEKSGKGLSALTRAYCLKQNMSAAQAEFPKVPKPLQAACRQWCAQFDIEFEAR